MNDWLRVVAAVAGKDIVIEWRTKTALLSALVFAAMVLVIFNFARDASLVSASILAPSVLWITFAFAGMIALNRGFNLEKDNAAIEGLLLAPVSRRAIFFGKFIANLAFVGLVEAVALPLFVLFFNVGVWHILPGLIGLMVAATIGFVAVGTVFSAMTVRTRFSELILPMLLLPFMVTPLIVAVQVTTRLFDGRPLSEMLGWLRILILYDLVFVTLCTLLFPAVVDE